MKASQDVLCWNYETFLKDLLLCGRPFLASGAEAACREEKVSLETKIGEHSGSQAPRVDSRYSMSMNVHTQIHIYIHVYI